ncbi:Cytochrome c oxidase polypeptide VIIc [Aphelenchoides bicaudatus]|nr:Cytochrome c oxidase polypeptide VIIc [Aphelenchoides bicaudatus]
MSLARVAFRPLVTSIRCGSSTGGHLPNNGATLPDMTKWTPQSPTGVVHEGWATARIPFRARRPRLFVLGATTIMAIGFWLPFFLVEYQLRKANQ